MFADSRRCSLVAANRGAREARWPWLVSPERLASKRDRVSGHGPPAALPRVPQDSLAPAFVPVAVFPAHRLVRR